MFEQGFQFQIHTRRQCSSRELSCIAFFLSKTITEAMESRVFGSQFRGLPHKFGRPHRFIVPTSTPRRKCLHLWYGRASRTISRRLVNHCRIGVNSLGVRIHANCESASQPLTNLTFRKRKTYNYQLPESEPITCEGTSLIKRRFSGVGSRYPFTGPPINSGPPRVHHLPLL